MAGDLGLGDFDLFKQSPASHPSSHGSSDVEWSVQNSRPANQIQDIVNSLDAHFNPTHPRILELDIQKQSYKRASLGEFTFFCHVEFAYFDVCSSYTCICMFTLRTI